MLLWVGVALVGMATPTTWTSAPTDTDVWKKILSTYSGTKAPATWTATDNGLEAVWNMTYEWTTANQNFQAGGTNGLIFGSSTKGIKTVTLKSTSFAGETISKITIKGVAAGKGGTVNATATVGTTVFTGNPASVSGTSNTDLVFTGNATGEITIVLTQQVNGKQITIKGLSVEYDNGGGNPDPVTVTPPTITINGTEVEGVYEEGATATIAGGEDAVMIMYTTNGQDPSYQNSIGILYEEKPIALSVGENTIKAIAIDNDGNESKVETKIVTVVAKQGPVVDKPEIIITGEKSGEDYLIGATASISAPKASYIFYTTDGSDPKAEGNSALEAVEAKSVDLGTLSVGPTTIQAYVWDAEGDESDVASMTVNVVKKPAELAWSKVTCTVYLGEEPYDLPTLTHAAGIADNELVYSIPAEDSGIATIDKDGNVTIVGLGTTTVTATYTTTETSEIDNGTASYKLVVADKGSIHKTSYLFDFKNQDYGLTHYNSGNKYETDVENPVRVIMRKGVTLNFIVPENASTTTTYRYWAASAGNDFRIYSKNAINISVPENGRILSVTFIKGNSGDFAMVPEIGTMTGKAYLDGKVTWNAPEGEIINSIKFTSEQNEDYNNSSTGRTYTGGIEVVYDLGKPAMPYVVSEDDSKIEIACDDYCVLHYTKVPHNGGAQAAPSRAPIAGTGKDLVDSETWYDHEAATLTIDKTNQSHVNRGYSFTAYHGDTDMRSDALNILVDQKGTLTGVEGISAEADADAPVEFYDLQGRKVANPQGGIFIRRQGSKVTKVAL